MTIMRRVLLLLFITLGAVVGSRAQNLYVSPSGNDAAEGTATSPLRTIGRALSLANDSATHIFVAEGNYTENATLELHSNLVVEGGLNDSTWQMGSNATFLTINTIEYVGNYSHKIGLRSENDTNWLLLRMNITVAAATDADRAASGKGATVYVIHVSGNAAGNRIVDCQLTAGNGGNGLNGSNGVAGTSGNNGSEGGNGGLSPLTNSGTDVGTGGSASGSGLRAGGKGGNGGAGGEGNENNGNSGQNGLSGGNGTGGTGGVGGGTTAPSHDGAAGATGSNGNNGVTIPSGNTYAWLLYFVPAETGNAGTDGAGGGGGGGGAGGGSATGTTLLIPNQYCGGAGGGGGAGGTGGTGGTAGTAGGGCFGIYCASGQSPFIQNTVIFTGNAGHGGQGGIGGQGGQGGQGGSGGSCSVTGNAGKGGRGGNGGNGGRGGNGENGCDGAALRVAIINDAELVAEDIATPSVAECQLCGNEDATVEAIPGYGGQICQWFAADNDSVPVTTGNVLEVGNVSEAVTYHAYTYDTVRNVRSYEYVTVVVYPSYSGYEFLTIHESELPYTYCDTVFDAGTVTGEYIFRHYTVMGCDSTMILSLMVVPDDTVGVTEAGEVLSGLTIYPNPVSGGTVTVRCHATCGNRWLGIYDVGGRLLGTKELVDETTVLDVTGLPKGLYLLRVTDGDGSVCTAKFVIN